MVKIRLARMGKKKQPIYKIVAADSKAPRDGRFLEAVGIYDPRSTPSNVQIKETVLFKWLKRGAQPTDTVHSLIKREGLMLKWRLIKKNADEATIADEMSKFLMVKTEKERRKAERKLRVKAAHKKKAAGEVAASSTATP